MSFSSDFLLVNKRTCRISSQTSHCNVRCSMHGDTFVAAVYPTIFVKLNY